ncbi:MAG: aldolase/citrate lyase family protein [Candidatus Moduliflexus flocculans]|nr:aldolase/citrate lyase family protein [Candidatus Moduliflexus flocculans]
MKNILKEKLAAGVRPIGTFFELGSEPVAEALGRTGLDFLIVDNEHGPFEAERTADFIRAAELVGIAPLARVREISRPAVLKLLDVGAQGIIVPDVHTVDQVRALVDYASCSHWQAGLLPDPEGRLGLRIPRHRGSSGRTWTTATQRPCSFLSARPSDAWRHIETIAGDGRRGRDIHRPLRPVHLDGHPRAVRAPGFPWGPRDGSGTPAGPRENSPSISPSTRTRWRRDSGSGST